jgi:hypothetical protein
MTMRCRWCKSFLAHCVTRFEDAVLLGICAGKWGEVRTLDHAVFGDEPPPCGKLREHPRHEFVQDHVVILHRTCRRCGRDNQEVSL